MEFVHDCSCKPPLYALNKYESEPTFSLLAWVWLTCCLKIDSEQNIWGDGEAPNFLTCQACLTSTPLAYSNLTPPVGWFFTHFQDVASGCQGISPCSCSSWDAKGVMNETMFQDVSSGTINPGWSVICHQPGIAPLQRKGFSEWHHVTHTQKERIVFWTIILQSFCF